jgi:hypothetical protein
MVRTQIQLSEKQAKDVKRVARTRGVSMAEVIRQAVDAIIGATPNVCAEEQRARALSAVGKFRSGRVDVSRNHDRHLEDGFDK